MPLLIVKLREEGDRLRIGDALIEYRLRSGGQVVIAIEAPSDTMVIREERSRPMSPYARPRLRDRLAPKE